MREQDRQLENAVVDAIEAERLMAHARHIASKVRLSGSQEEREIAEWITAQLRSFGFATQLIEHDAYISLPIAATCEVASATERFAVPCITHSFACSTPAGGVEAELVFVDSLSAAALEQVRGKIVLLHGLATPASAVALSEAGAIGQIHICPGDQRYEMIVSPVWGSPSHETRQQLPTTHIVSVNTPDGERLKSLLQRGAVTVHLETEVSTSWRKIPLVIGDLRSHAGSDDYVLLSGHLDSWHYGAMDNASANAVMLEICRLFAAQAHALQRGLRVAFWSGHSHGRYAGSAWYVDEYWEDLDRHCVLHVNVESPGAIGATVLDSGPAHTEARNLVSNVIREYAQQTYSGGRMYRAGDESFWPIGIPAIHFESNQNRDDGGLNPSGDLLGTAATKANGYGWWWHTPSDTVDKLDPAHLLRDARIHAAITWRLLTAAVLPLDYQAVVTEIKETLRARQAACRSHVDLTPCLEVAEQLGEKLAALYNIAQAAADGPAVSHINRCLKQLGRTLIPLTYTSGDRFAQDPALPVPDLPALADAALLKNLPVDADEAKFIAVALRRGRNRVRHSLLAALAAVEQCLNALNNATAV